MTETEYQLKLDVVEALVALDPEADTLAGQLLDQLAVEVEAYEREHFPLFPEGEEQEP